MDASRTTTPPPNPIEARRVLKRHVAAAVVGNALEFYDFTLYSLFAGQIGRTFFPAHTPFMSLILSLLTFGAGFATRPLGALVIGAYADRAGRKPAMLVSFMLMGVSILALALTPSHAAIGPAAAVIVVVIRLAQGFALGGNVGPTTAFLIESVEPDRRGLYSAWQSTSQGLAALAGGAVAFTLASLMSPAVLEAWGWRIAFAIGAIILPVGLIIRGSLPETLHAEIAADETVSAARPPVLRMMVFGLLLIASLTIGYYTMLFMTTYAAEFLHMQINLGFAAPMVFGLTGVIVCQIAGALSDRYGRRSILIGPRILMAILAVPGFALVAARRDAATLLGVTAVLASINHFSGVGSVIVLAEGLPPRFRSAGFGIVFSIAVAIFGGSTQPAIAYLIHRTGNLLAPGWVLTGAAVFGLVVALFLPETAPRVLAKRAAKRVS